jgi:hypothetical protein
MSIDLARTVNTPVVTWADVLRYLKLDPGSVQAHAVAAVCKRYGLDPLLNHVRIVEHQVYPTRDGMLHVAHQSGQLDGIVVDEERRNTADDGWTAYVSVWRKDMSHPFRYGAQCKDREGKPDGPAMALARAERRALRRAFDIVADDGDTDDPVIRDEPDPPAHRVMEGVPPTDKLVCSCGEVFATAAGFHQHLQPAEIPGPVSTAGHAPAGAATPVAAPAGPGPKTYKARKSRPVETGPPVDFYDNLPESRGYNG